MSLTIGPGRNVLGRKAFRNGLGDSTNQKISIMELFNVQSMQNRRKLFKNFEKIYQPLVFPLSPHICQYPLQIYRNFSGGKQWTYDRVSKVAKGLGTNEVVGSARANSFKNLDSL